MQMRFHLLWHWNIYTLCQVQLEHGSKKPKPVNSQNYFKKAVLDYTLLYYIISNKR